MQINPREVAAAALQEIAAEGAYNHISLRRILRRNGAMPREDRAFVTELVNGSLRNLLYLDFVLDNLSSLPTAKMKPWVLAVLRTAAYQILFMDKVPASAACNEAVGLIKARGLGQLSGFVNGILRTLVRDGAPPLPQGDSALRISLQYSHPLWLVKLWLAAYPPDFVEALCAKNNTAPPITVAANPLKTTTPALRRALEDAGVEVQPGTFEPNALRLKKTADLTKLPAFAQGWFHVQDESSMAAVDALDPRPGDRMLDVCAAPGGKSLLAAERMENEGYILSRDIYEHKLALLQETAARLGIAIIETQEYDATNPDAALAESFDKVLVDAPCTGFGLIRKKPDIKYHRTGADIDALSTLQREILTASSGYVRPGGTLVYSTCTICRKENENNVAWFLKENPQYERAEDFSVFYPHIHDTDGFFIAKLIRKEA